MNDPEPTWTRQVMVDPERLTGWTDRFRQAHGRVDWTITADAAMLGAADGAHARLVNLWEPLPEEASPGEVLRHLVRDRVVGIILGRKAAHAVGIAVGSHLEASKVDRTYVQGRTKAGGWSQQRYARRRGNQTDKAVEETIERCVERLLPRADELDGVVCGGDKAFLAAVLADSRLSPLAARRTRHPVLAVVDPREAVLKDAIQMLRAVPIDLDDAAQARR